MKPLPDFHFDELVWRTDFGLIDQALTELTAIRDESEFEKLIFLIRISRALSGVGEYRNSSVVGNAIYKCVVKIAVCFLFACDLLLKPYSHHPPDHGP